MTAPEPGSVESSSPVSYAVVGGGFRAEVFLRIADQLPSTFRVSGVVTRRPTRGAELAQRWGVATYPTLDALLDAGSPDFVVVSVSQEASAAVIAEVVARGLPVLAETPPALDLAGLTELHRLVQQGARIQVAEQYHREPLIEAQIAVARSARLGRVTRAFVSVAHDYHGISVLRRLLGVDFQNAAVTAHSFSSRVKAGPDRSGDPRQERWTTELHTSARLDFGDRLGGYDFTSDQYRSWLRTPTVLVRGELGELRDEQVRYLQDYRTPVTVPLTRLGTGGAGTHGGLFLRGYSAGEEWLYRNHFMPARLADDELSVAAILAGMRDYLAGGPEVYSLAEASQDQYLQLVVRRAVESGTTVHTETQPWAR